MPPKSFNAEEVEFGVLPKTVSVDHEFHDFKMTPPLITAVPTITTITLILLQITRLIPLSRAGNWTCCPLVLPNQLLIYV